MEYKLTPDTANSESTVFKCAGIFKVDKPEAVVVFSDLELG